jgi:anti-sigma28 factor (negative regulator of flagellin synthesis)
VEDLKEAIEDGSYHVESHKLAKKVVDDVLSEALMNQLEGKNKG